MEGRTRMLLQSLLKHSPLELNLTFFTLLCLFIAIFVFKLTRKRRRNQLNLPPSPPKFPFIGNLHQLGTLPHRSLTALSHKYGPLMFLRLGQTPTVVVSSAHFARQMIKSHDVVVSDRPQTTAAKIIVYGCRDVAFLPYGEEWRFKRKISVIELLSLKRVQSFQYIREEEVADLVNKIREACAEKKNETSMNMSQLIIATSNNIVSRCLLRQKFDTADGKSFGDLARRVMVHMTAFSVGNFFPSLKWMDVVTGLIPKINATFRELDAFFDELLAEHKSARRNEDADHKSEKKDFIDILHQLQQDDQLDFELTQADLKAMIMDMFAGESDTTSTALEWALAELIKNPRTLKKAQEEVSRVVGNKSKVEEDDVRQMKYLECVVKETLRFHPPLAPSFPRETRSGVTLEGYYIPPKTTMLVNSWGIQRDHEL